MDVEVNDVVNSPSPSCYISADVVMMNAARKRVGDFASSIDSSKEASSAVTDAETGKGNEGQPITAPPHIAGLAEGNNGRYSVSVGRGPPQVVVAQRGTPFITSWIEAGCPVSQAARGVLLVSSALSRVLQSVSKVLRAEFLAGRETHHQPTTRGDVSSSSSILPPAPWSGPGTGMEAVLGGSDLNGAESMITDRVGVLAASFSLARQAKVEV